MATMECLSHLLGYDIDPIMMCSANRDEGVYIVQLHRHVMVYIRLPGDSRPIIFDPNYGTVEILRGSSGERLIKRILGRYIGKADASPLLIWKAN